MQESTIFETEYLTLNYIAQYVKKYNWKNRNK